VNNSPFFQIRALAKRALSEMMGESVSGSRDWTSIRKQRQEYFLFAGSVGVRVEVKSSRAIHTKKRGGLASKALRYGGDEPFWMNFQQLKPDVCDVFVFIGVWVNRIVYWVISSEEAESSEYLSHQHRGGIEYQIGITNSNIDEFERFQTNPEQLGNKVLSLGASSL